MSTYRSIVTTLGLAKIATALANESTVALTEMAVGDGGGNPTTPTAGQTALVNERYRATLNNLVRSPQNPNWVLAEVVIPANVGGWTVREVGLFDSDGALIAVGNFPATYKPVLSEGAGGDLIVRVVLELGQPEAVELVIDPSVVLASRQWVSDNFTIAFQMPGGATGHVLRKASNQDGDVEWYDPVGGFNILVDVIEEGQDLSTSQTVVDLQVATASACAVYLDGVRLEKGADWTPTGPAQIELDSPAAGGERILVVQNEPNSGFKYLELENRLAEIAADGPTAQAAALENLGINPPTSNLLDALENALNQRRYPVGEILITRRTGNPSSWLNFGTWVRFASGRVLVGFDEGDATFNEVDKVGGAKTHTLTEAQMPTHKHNIVTHGNASANGDGTRVENTHMPQLGVAATETAGGGQAHNNLQPFIVVNMWRRTA